MNKQEAAKFLNVSEKTLERIVKKGELSTKHELTRTGKVAIFDDNELTNYKAKRDGGLIFPAITREQESPLLPLAIEAAGQVNAPNQITLIDALKSFAEAQNISALSHKLTLSINEAATLSGISKTVIKTAIKAGTLKTVAGQRGAKNIRRVDLEEFINSL